MLLFFQLIEDISRISCNPVPKWSSECSALGQISPQRAVVCTNVKVNNKTENVNSLYTFKAFMSWIVSSNHQWTAAGASGRHGNHAVWRVEGDTGCDFAHALIQRQNGTGWIALGPTSTQRAVICRNVKVRAVVDVLIWKFFPQNNCTFWNALVCPLLFIPKLSYIWFIGCFTCTIVSI